MHPIAVAASFVVGARFQAAPGDTGAPCQALPARSTERPECLAAARVAAERRLDSVVARILDALPDVDRATFDSAGEAWGTYENAECMPRYARAQRGRGADTGEIAFRTVLACHARLTDDRTRYLREAYGVDTLPAVAARPCLKYDPDVVALAGKLERHTYPGNPNYESIARGDAAESGLYLHLDRSLCVTGNLGVNGSPYMVYSPIAGVRVVQLALDDALARALRGRVGQRVALRGVLFEPGTLHWHARLVFDARAGRPASRP